MPMTMGELRRLTVSQSLFSPTTLKRALHRMQFVQADPIRSPARAQDLILRHRVKRYHAGDLERRYTKLDIAEDFFINYGFVTRELQALMHPRSESGVPAAGCLPWPAARRKKAQLILDFVGERGVVHPQEVDKHFAHGKVTNYWGGRSNATTHLLDQMHYRGLLRVVRRESGIRLYAVHAHTGAAMDDAERHRRLDRLADVVIEIYAPMPLRSLRLVLRRLRYAAPQWDEEIPGVIERAKTRLAHETVDGADWFWPAKWKKAGQPDDTVRLLAPFDPVVWDRWRFEALWGWTYRFEAYTPVAKRVRGYYAMPMLWRDQLIGWANLTVRDGSLISDFGYISTPQRDPVFLRELDRELELLRTFLRLG